MVGTRAQTHSHAQAYTYIYIYIYIRTYSSVGRNPTPASVERTRDERHGGGCKGDRTFLLLMYEFSTNDGNNNNNDVNVNAAIELTRDPPRLCAAPRPMVPLTGVETAQSKS